MSDLGIEQTKKLSDAEVEQKREVVNKVMQNRRDLIVAYLTSYCFDDIRLSSISSRKEEILLLYKIVVKMIKSF